MKTQIHINKCFFEYTMSIDPILLPDGQTLDDIWQLLITTLENEDGLSSVIDHILNTQEATE